MPLTQADVLSLFTQVSAIKNSDQLLMIKANGNGTVTAAKITAELLRAYLGAGYAITIDEDGYICIGGVRTEYQIDIQGGGGGTFDEQGRYIITHEGQRYLIPVTPLTKPNPPSISQTSYGVIEGSFDVTVANHASGSTMYAKVGSGQWTAITGNKITINSGYSNSSDNAAYNLTIKLKAELNGEYSDESTFSLSVYPIVAPGSITVSPSNDPYATSATITFHASPTTGATSSYKLASASSFTEFGVGETTHIETVYESAVANTYKVKATKSNYTDATVVGNAAFTLNKPKIYWAVVDTLPTTNEQVKALANALKRDTFPTITLPSSNVQGKKLVLAYNHSTVGKDVTSVKMGGFDYEFVLTTVGSFTLCVCDNLAASAAGLTTVYA